MFRVGPALSVLIVLSACFSVGHSARILGFFPSLSKSHLIIHMSTIRPMIERGHDVTIVSSVPINEPNLNFRHVKIDLPEFEFSGMGRTTKGFINTFKLLTKVSNLMLDQSELALNSPGLQKLMAEESFDLVVLGYFFNDYLIGVAGHFKCPIIVNWMSAPVRNLANFVGNPAEPFYVPALMSGLYQPMDFIDRVKNVLYTGVELATQCYVQYQMNKYYQANFPAERYPSYAEMKRNVSMIFVNSYLNQGSIQPNVPAVVQIGGIQIKPKPSPLPEDIKTYLDSASKDGVIYFCLGTNIDKQFLSPEFIGIIFNVLSSLKQKVIWKWNEDDIPGNSSNIFYKNWLPQNDILAHPNLKLFITHGGAGGVAEAQYHGVPMLVIPFFADQFANANKVRKSGHGLTVDVESLTETLFHEAVMEVLENRKFRDSVQTFSRIFRDRPLNAQDTAAFWMEYVIRHKGAKHLQSPAVHMSAIQYYGLDVLGFLGAIAYVFCKLCALAWRKTVGVVCRKCCKKNKSVTSKKKTQ